MASGLELEVSALARRITELGADEDARVFTMSRWSELMLRWAMSHPAFKTQLFRFVDVFPALGGDADVLRHVQEYFEGTEVPSSWSTASTWPAPSRSAAGFRRPSPVATSSAWAGNVYVNRGTTGAVVGRQPFGGYGLSGVGSKAGPRLPAAVP